MIKPLQRIGQNKTIRQSGLLLFSTVLGMVCLLSSNYFLTKIISAEDFGNYSFILNLFNFFQVVFNFGFFYSINRQVSLSKDEIEIRKLFAIGIILVILLSVPMMATIYVYVNFFMNDRNLTLLINTFIPFGVIFLMTNFNELILQGANKIKILAFSRFFPKLLNLIIVGFVFYFFINSYSIKVSNFLFYYILSLSLGYIVVIFLVKPFFFSPSKMLAETFKFNKDFGFNVYVGSIIALGASSLNGILIGNFGESNLEVGFYAIALQFTAPLTLIPNVIATTSFKSFSESTKIDRNLLIGTIIISVLSFIVMFFLSSFIVEVIYGKEYLKAIPLVQISSLGAIFYGLSDFFNRFLLANGKGKELRNTSFVVGAVMLISSFILVRQFGGIGASFSYLISGTTYLLVIIYFVKSFKK